MNSQAYHPSEELGFVRLKWLLGRAIDGVDFIYRYRKLFVVVMSGVTVVSQLMPKGGAVVAQTPQALPVVAAEAPKILSQALGQTREEAIVVPGVQQMPVQVREILPEPLKLPAEVKQLIKPSPYKTVDVEKVKLRVLTDQERAVAADLIFEAGGEKDAIRGMQAVANVIQNRARYAGVPLYNPVAVPQQFSCFDDVTRSARPGFLDKVNVASKHTQWENACKLVILAVKNKLPDITNGATHYSNPKHSAGYAWEGQLKDALVIGEHVFGKAKISKKLCGLGLSEALLQAASRRQGQERKGPREVSR